MKKSRIVMFLGVLLIGGLFIFPLWHISLGAPQYPTPLGMEIFIDKFADTNEFDIQNINLMNHYVGMKFIPEFIPEMELFPIVAAIMIALGVIVGFVGNYKLYLVFFIVMSILGALAIYDFYLWTYDYGHNLDPKAIMKFTNPDGSPMGYQPPLFGTKNILNFTAGSYPRGGAYFMVAGMLLVLASYFVGKKESKKKLDKLQNN